MVMQTDEEQPSPQRLREEISRLGPWFHNLRLGGVETAPDHFLGDFPANFFGHFHHAFPAELEGKTVLDVGCNAGFYLLELRRRGAAHVVGIDTNPRYLAQAELAIRTSRLDRIELRQLSVYDVEQLGRRFDVVLFLGVLYHLRHPLLALDLLREHAVGELLYVQCMQRGPASVAEVPKDLPFSEQSLLSAPDYPHLAFVEHRYAGDPTNWWIPNRAGMEAMLRSAGFQLQGHPDAEVYVCRAGPLDPHAERLQVRQVPEGGRP